MQQIAIIGLGRYGFRLATLLAKGGADVIAIDESKDLIQEISDNVSLAVCLDSTDEKALLSQGVDKVDVAMVGIGGDFEAAALTTAVLKRIGVKRVIARATTNTRGQILTAIGADEIVNPEKDAAERWKSRLLAPSIIDRSVLAQGHSLAQVSAPKSWTGKTLEELSVGKRFKVLVVAIRRTTIETVKGEQVEKHLIETAPGPAAIIQPTDVLFVIGSDQAIELLPTS